MAVIQIQTRDIHHPFTALGGAVDLVVSWDRGFADSSGAVARGELRAALTRITGNRWRIPAVALWTAFDLTVDPGVCYTAWFECDGRIIEWPALRQFHINVPAPTTTYDELIAVERIEERGQLSETPLFIRRDGNAAAETLLVIAPEFDAKLTPIMLRFGNGNDAPFFRYSDGAFVYSLDGLSVIPFGVGGGGGGLTAVLPVRSVSGNTTLNPASDGLLIVDTGGGDIDILLASPAPTQRNSFLLKKKTADANRIRLIPDAGSIENAAFYDFSGAQLTSGDGLHLAYDNVDWWVFPS